MPLSFEKMNFETVPFVSKQKRANFCSTVFADIMHNHMSMMPVYSLGLVVCVKLGCTTGGIRQAVAVVYGAVAAFPNVVVGGGNLHA